MSSFERRRFVRLADQLRRSGRPGCKSDPIAAAVWITLSMATLAWVAAIGKYLILEGLDPFVVVFFRNLFGLLWMLPMLYWRGFAIARSENFRLYGMRVLVSLIAMTAWFSALSRMPIAELQAINFLSPLFATLFAIVFLGEVVRGRRWTALAVGFAGAMIILRPWHTSLGLGQLLALCSALGTGLLAPLIKQLTVKDDSGKVVFITYLWLTPLSLPPALLVWQWPSAEQWPYFIAMGAAGYFGHLALVRGFNAADASLAATFDFSRLPFAVLLGYLWFGELIDLWTWVGAVIIFGAVIYITRREAELGRIARPVGGQ